MGDMRGVITTRDVLRHPLLIARHMGIGCYLRCLRAIVSGRQATFLGECVRLASTDV